ncbi:MAG: SUMF1/EgtB/PvdO family nonheme iron enzyme, partial [Janthinobacterium lividum]
LVSNGDYLAFIRAGGYRTSAFWLSEGWDWISAEGLSMPLYWHELASGSTALSSATQPGQGVFHEFTLHGLVPLDLSAPASHLSFFEADAYARWAGARLPTEAEWEHAANDDAGALLQQMFGTCWQWTTSSYAPYPGYATAPGAIGEYNGKFMVNQYVLRGSSCATPAGHSRPSYRNFFPTTARWQFSGIRLARALI